MRTACEWHHEQLLQAHLRMDQCNALRIKKGQIPTTLTTSLTCDHACKDEGLDITATDTHLHCDPDNHQRLYPFHPGHYLFTTPRELHSDRVDKLPCSLLTWQLFTSCVRMLLCWSINCPQPSNKMMKIPTQYRLPTLPKGWRYEDDVDKVKRETLDDPAMELLDRPATMQRVEDSVGSGCRSLSWRILRSMRGTR